jgi:hypothetical protein
LMFVRREKHDRNARDGAKMERASKVRSISGQGVAFAVSVAACWALVVSTRSNWAERGSIGRNCAELSASGFNRVQRGSTGCKGS